MTGRFELKELEELLIERFDESTKDIKNIFRYISYEIDGKQISRKDGIIKEGQILKLSLLMIGG